MCRHSKAPSLQRRHWCHHENRSYRGSQMGDGGQARDFTLSFWRKRKADHVASIETLLTTLNSVSS